MDQISIDQQARVRLTSITDRAGNPAPIQGVPDWASSDPTLMTVTADPDGAGDPTLALCVPMDGAADQLVDVTATVDADLGEGVQPIVGVINWAIVGGRAVFVGLSVEALEAKPAA
jgi:hypothetical protein